jgi:hypothetical protein
MKGTGLVSSNIEVVRSKILRAPTFVVVEARIDA